MTPLPTASEVEGEGEGEAEVAAPPPVIGTASGLIDCDVHLDVPSVEVLLPYLAEYWRTYIRESAFKGPADTSYPPGAATSGPARAPDPAAPPGTALDQIRRVLADEGASHAILTCAYAVESLHNPFAAAALAEAVNRWQIEAWLDPEPRLRGSILVPVQDPALAAAEIDRVGDHPAIVQVLLPVRSEAPYGNRRYYPIFEAALRHDLAIGIQFGGRPSNPPTPVGWPSSYAEEYVGMASVFQSQLIGLITEGVFDKFPDLRVALIESGVGWLPSLLWRLDKEWKGLRREIPWVRRPPSDYVRDHVRLTTQPLDASPGPDPLAATVDLIGSDDLLMYASDHPHDHGPAASTLLAALAPDLERKIGWEVPAAFYRLA